MSNNYVPIYNFTNLFHRDILLYAIGDWRLGAPLLMRRVGYTAFFAAIWIVPIVYIFGFHMNPYFLFRPRRRSSARAVRGDGRRLNPRPSSALPFASVPLSAHLSSIGKHCQALLRKPRGSWISTTLHSAEGLDAPITLEAQSGQLSP